jgi:hypothetical protein
MKLQTKKQIVNHLIKDLNKNYKKIISIAHFAPEYKVVTINREETISVLEYPAKIVIELRSNSWKKERHNAS